MVLRPILRQATRAAHCRVDGAFSPLDLERYRDYCIFLMAHAAVVLPLEAWAERTLARQVLDDWPQRRRSDALLQDLCWLGLQPPPSLADMPPVGPASLLGMLYVLEGSRLGAQVCNWGKTPGTQLQQNKGQSGSVTLPP